MNILPNVRSCLAATILLALPAAAGAAPLTVVNVGAPAVNCVFNTTCTITVNDTVGAIAVPGAVGTARLQSRAFVGTGKRRRPARTATCTGST